MSEPAPQPASPPAPDPLPQAVPPQLSPTPSATIEIPTCSVADLGVYTDPAERIKASVPRGWNTALVAVEPYGRDFKVLQTEMAFGLVPEEVLKQWQISWNRDPAADRGAIKLPIASEDGELAFSIVLQQAGKPVCVVVHQAFIPGVFTSAGVFDAEERIASVFKHTVLRALFDQLNVYLKKAFPGVSRRRPRREDAEMPTTTGNLELADETPPGS